jgi:hypothetical protein
MGRALTRPERASRVRTMMELRRWMERGGVSRPDVARELRITVGHLSTLINANRMATEEHCQRAVVLMGRRSAAGLVPRIRAAVERPLSPRRPPRVSKLRPLTETEVKFVQEVAEAWIKSNPNATQDDFVGVVRALSIGIRS